MYPDIFLAAGQLGDIQGGGVVSSGTFNRFSVRYSYHLFFDCIAMSLSTINISG